MFFVNDGLDAAQVAIVLIVLGEFIVKTEVDGFVGIEGVFHMEEKNKLNRTCK